jgi:multidrug transporter EmrE-like cation transporter
MKNSFIWLPLLAAAISAFGQVLLKYAMIQVGPLNYSLSVIFRALSQPYLPLALFIYVLALFLWLEVLSKTPLSIAYPILAVTYVLVPLLSYIIFNEPIKNNQLIGTFLILVGIAIIGR